MATYLIWGFVFGFLVLLLKQHFEGPDENDAVITLGVIIFWPIPAFLLGAIVVVLFLAAVVDFGEAVLHTVLDRL